MTVATSRSTMAVAGRHAPSRPPRRGPFFDKETDARQDRDPSQGRRSGQEVSEESFPSEYKEVQGTKQAMKFTIKRDGKLFMEGEASEIQLSEKLDASLFAKP